MPDNDAAPLLFDRNVRSQFAGCAAYLLMVPTFALVAGIVGAAAGFGLTRVLGTSENASGIAALVLGAVSCTGGIWLGIWDFYRRAWDKILIYPDRLELGRGKA